ncbi:MAG: class I SAM-dependent methyltransferase [Cyanobacteria bacterium SBLK]|nr:class I SAM-dependent methyltransferase [Cyanobacteria bacterium SBLK]
MIDRNQKIYKMSHIVGYYSQIGLLQPAEQAISNRLKDCLSNLKMLDIGIGGGRTTQHFSSLVKEYTGIDYSEEMIAACQKKFAYSSQFITLEVGDARKMRFSDNSFDFILFSFNGIDYVSHGDRLQILQEIRRVGKPGCYVFFSSHNLKAMEKMFAIKTQFSLNPFKTYVNLVMLALLRLFNFGIDRDRIKNSSHIILRDESHNFCLQTYYIRPKEQIKQLEANFKDIEIYSWQNGRKILSEGDRALDVDMWLYYFCTLDSQK